MSGYFENKVAVVTGAASGIGLGITEKLLSSGAAAVFMGDLKEENLKKEADRLAQAYPGKVYPLQTDVTNLQALQGDYALLVNTDGDPGRTIYVGTVDPDGPYAPDDGDVWLEP